MRGLETLLKTGVQLRALKNLHSKLYIFDSQYVILGSANYTLGGLYLNHEIGIIFEHENEISEECNDYFGRLWEAVCKDDEGIITQEWIDEEDQVIEKMVFNLKENSKANIKKRGTSIRKNIEFDDWKDYIENETLGKGKYMLRETVSGIIERSLNLELESYESDSWIKFEGISEERRDNEQKYFDFKNDWPETYFPKNPSGIKKGETIFIAVVSYDQNDLPTPMIIGYAKAAGFDARNVATSAQRKLNKWKNRFPYYIEFTEGKILNSSLKNGISILDVYKNIGSSTFPSTINRDNITANDLKKMHHRRSHLRLTYEAKKYLISELEKLFDKYGYIQK